MNREVKKFWENLVGGVIKIYCMGGWRDGSEIKNTDCSFRGPEFYSQQPHGGSQSSIMRSCVLLLYADRTLYT